VAEHESAGFGERTLTGPGDAGVAGAPFDALLGKLFKDDAGVAA
jgi:hypothetical protein